MSNFKHYNDIVELIAREVVNELSSDEMKKLKAWINDCPENELLYNHIRNSENFKFRNIE